jgi:hypothetical protein
MCGLPCFLVVMVLGLTHRRENPISRSLWERLYSAGVALSNGSGPVARCLLYHHRMNHGNSYAPFISCAELHSTRMVTTLGRSVNVAVGGVFLRGFFFSFFSSDFLVLLFSSGFLFPFLFYSFSFLKIINIFKI